MIGEADIACVVLAGGLGKRLGASVQKPLVDIGGRPMIAHVLDRVLGLFELVLVSANDLDAFAGLGLPVVPDRRTERLGPLAALEAAALHLRAAAPRITHLLSLPGDTPFLPPNIAARLSAGAGDRPHVAASNGRLHPTAASWPVSALESLGDRLDGGGALSLRSVLEQVGFTAETFASSPDAPSGDPFFNVNTPADLERARAAFRPR